MYHSTHKPLYLSIVRLIHLNQDLPLLDRVGSKDLCRDHSFIHDTRILRSVNLSSFDKPIFKNISPFSFLAMARTRSRNNICTSPNYVWCRKRDNSNKFRFVHGRERSGDKLDRVQDPQSVLGHQGHFSRANFWFDGGFQTSTYHIRDYRIRNGAVRYPTGSRRAFQPATGSAADVVL